MVVIPIADKADGLAIGNFLVVSGLLGYSVARVVAVKGNMAEAESDGCAWFLEFGNDDRKCWATVCQVNKSLLGSSTKCSLDVTPQGDQK